MTVSRASAAFYLRDSDPSVEESKNLVGLLTRAAQLYRRSGVCWVSGEREGESVYLTYRALRDQALKILGGLQTFSRPPGSKIALLLENTGDFIPAFWACILGGYIPCPLVLIRNDVDRWMKHLAHIGVLLDQPLFVTTEALLSELPNVSAVDLRELRGAAPSKLVFEASKDDPAMMVLTSGSTGNSKAVVLTHGNLLASMAAKNEKQQLTANDVTFNWISFDHVAALLEAHMLPLYVGAMQLHAEPAAILSDPLLFLRLIDHYRVSMTFTPNFLLGQINAALQSQGHAELSARVSELDLSSLRHIVSGGEAIVVETGRKFLDLLAPSGLDRTALWPAFGMTETCAGSVYSQDFPDNDSSPEFASLGQPISGLQMRIVDDYGAALHPGEVGELQLRGPMVFSHYHNNEAATRAAFSADSWFRTGDLGRIENNRLSLVGRSKDSIIVSGVNYFSHELETTVEQLDGIEKSFVAAFPIRPKGADTEQLVVTFATTFPPSDETRLHQLTVAVRNSTILLWGFRPAQIVPLPKSAFPKTSLGKIQRSILRKRFEAGDLLAHQTRISEVTRRQLGDYSAPHGQAETDIAKIFSELFNIDAGSISATASFFDLGGTSLDIVKLKKSLQTFFGVEEFPIARILQNPTVRGLASPDKPRYEPIVPLQITGNKTPLFCVHPGIGEILVFVNLAKYFVNDRPFYALRARGFNEGEKYFESFSEMIDAYVEAIRARQPHGPYAIAGYSYGGPVAFEIAKALEASGERVAFVSSIDMPPCLYVVDAIECAVHLAFFLSLIDKRQMDELPAVLRALPNEDPCAYLVRIAPRGRLAELDLDLTKFTAWARVAQSLLLLGENYVPTGTVESMAVFYAQPIHGSKESWLNTELKRWDAVTRAPNRYIECAGEHYEIMGPRYVTAFQAMLRREIDRAFDENR